MPIPPNPLTYSCRACIWSKTVAPRSDALIPGDYFERCPVCQKGGLKIEPASTVQAASACLGDRIWRGLS